MAHMPIVSGDLVMPEHLQQMLGPDAFEAVMGMQGEIFRDVPRRKTIRVTLQGKAYFIKQHFGVGWREIFKNLFSFRLPIIGASTEWQAIQKLGQIGIPTTPGVAFGQRGLSPAHQQSFVITEDLGDITSLETLCADWAAHPPAPAFKRQLLLEVARIARTLHGQGLNHRDFYLCHFCLDNTRLQAGDLRLYLIDLHRVGMRKRIPESARMKDIAGLYFSSLDAGLSKRDYLRFVRAYRGGLESLKDERDFWVEVDERARRLYYKMHRKWPLTPFDRVSEDVAEKN